MVNLRGAVAHDVSASDRTADVKLPEGVTFADMLLSERTLKGLHKTGFQRPSPIQRNAIPVGRCGSDLIVQAKSGTGKTLVFGIIALEMIDTTIAHPQVLILAPTREIAVQITQVLKSIGSEFPSLQIHSFIGGLDVKSQIAAASGCHIAVGTPGRVRQLVEEGCLVLRSTRLFVLDEADQLVSQSFTRDVNFIFKHLPDHKQTLVVSATFPEPLENLLKLYLVHPRRVSTTSASAPLLLGLKQYVAVTMAHTSPLVRVRNKTAKLTRILASLSFRQCLIFCNLQSRMEGICRELASQGWPALHLAGSMPQKDRLNIIAALQSQRCRVLLTTDLAARGIDAEQVDLVINMDLPYDTETYLHRVGRAGRFGAPGVAVSIVEDGTELITMQNIFYEVGGDDIKVPKVPDGKLTPAFWKKEADEFVEGIPKKNDEDQEGQTEEVINSDKQSEEEDMNSGELGISEERGVRKNGDAAGQKRHVNAKRQAKLCRNGETNDSVRVVRSVSELHTNDVERIDTSVGKRQAKKLKECQSHVEKVVKKNKVEPNSNTNESVHSIEKSMAEMNLEEMTCEKASALVKEHMMKVPCTFPTLSYENICSMSKNKRFDFDISSEKSSNIDSELLKMALEVLVKDEKPGEVAEKKLEEETSDEREDSSENESGDSDGSESDSTDDSSIFSYESELSSSEEEISPPTFINCRNKGKSNDSSNLSNGSYGLNGCRVCDNWFTEYRRHLAMQRHYIQQQIYVKELYKY